MERRDKSPDRPSDGAAARDERRGAALRANLARRKAQARGRAGQGGGAGADGADGVPHEDAQAGQPEPE